MVLQNESKNCRKNQIGHEVSPTLSASDSKNSTSVSELHHLSQLLGSCLGMITLGYLSQWKPRLKIQKMYESLLLAERILMFFTAISDIKTALGLSGFKQLKPIASLFATSGPTRTSPLVILSTKPAHPINKCCKKKQPTNLECQLFFLFPSQER